MRLLLIITFLHFLASASAQPADTIRCKKILFGWKYKKPDGKRLPNRELKAMLLSQPESKKYYLKYKRANITMNIISAGALVFLLAGNNNETDRKYTGKINPFIAIPTGLLAGSFTLTFHAERQKHKAVKAYNRSF
jgi:hypothetical protein